MLLYPVVCSSTARRTCDVWPIHADAPAVSSLGQASQGIQMAFLLGQLMSGCKDRPHREDISLLPLSVLV
jgi:hypothetical protein